MVEDVTKSPRNSRSLLLLVVIALIILAALAVIRFWPDTLGESTPSPTLTDAPPQGDTAPEAELPFDQLNRDESLTSLMADRKEQYQVGDGIDMLAQSNETVTIQGNRISMKDIQELIRQKTGELTEETIGPGGQPVDAAPEMFGLYVVQPGDNIWNIHFRFLQDHFRQKRIDLSPLADEPNPEGYSSGIGKLLKFSENLVYIYNIKDRTLDSDLNVIEPYSKIIIYKMDTIFQLLDQIDANRIDQIRFDGDTLWIPPES
jgi:hypothetical protein